MLDRRALQKFHGDKRLLLLFANVVNGADVGMIQRRGCLRFAPKTRQGLRIARQIGRKKLQGYEAVQPGIFGLVNHPHSSVAKLLDEVIVRDG